jgi:hypothetical protein
LRVRETINQERAPACEATTCEFGAVGHGTSVIGVWGKDLLDSSILLRAVVASESCELDLDGPVRDSAEGQVAQVTAPWIAALPCVCIGVLIGCLHLGDGHRHRCVLAERTDSWLVKPGRIAMARRLRAAVIDRLHGEGEVTNDLAKVHQSEATALVGRRLPHRRRRLGRIAGSFLLL